MTSAIDLGAADSYAVFAGVAVNNTVTNTLLTGDLGIYPGTTITNFPPGEVSGEINAGNDIAQQVFIDMSSAYNDAASATPATQADELGLDNATYPPGIYHFGANAILTGVLTLDGQHNMTSSAVWIFQVGNDLITENMSIVRLINGAKGKNVYWQVEGSVSLGANTQFIGTILAFEDINVGTLTTAQGGLLSRNGSVNLDDNPLVQSHFNNTATGGDPHVICLDGSRIDVYNPGYYRLFDNCDITGKRIIVNADVRRDEKTNDYYEHIWIQLNRSNQKQPTEYLLTFKKEGIMVNQSTEYLPKWEQTYLTEDNIKYIFTAESKYNSVFISTNDSTGPIKYAGLMAGVITSLKALEDISQTPARFIKPNYYQKNAIVVSSAGPQVISIQKHDLHPHSGWFRLLQWTVPNNYGVMNVLFDEFGRARELIIDAVRNGQSLHEEWKWEGEKHWKLTASRNQNVMQAHYCHEYNFDLTKDSLILIRVQGNGSISAAFRKIKKVARGLFFEDQIPVTGPHDYQIYPIYKALKPTKMMPSNATLYQKMIDPSAA